MAPIIAMTLKSQSTPALDQHRGFIQADFFLYLNVNETPNNASGGTLKCFRCKEPE